MLTRGGNGGVRKKKKFALRLAAGRKADGGFVRTIAHGRIAARCSRFGGLMAWRCAPAARTLESTVLMPLDVDLGWRAKLDPVLAVDIRFLTARHNRLRRIGPAWKNFHAVTSERI